MSNVIKFRPRPKPIPRMVLCLITGVNVKCTYIVNDPFYYEEVVT